MTDKDKRAAKAEGPGIRLINGVWTHLDREPAAVALDINAAIQSHFVSRETAEKMAEALRFYLSEGGKRLETSGRRGKEALEAFDKEFKS